MFQYDRKSIGEVVWTRLPRCCLCYEVVVLPREKAWALAERAIGMQQFEIDALAKMRAGVLLSELSGATRRVQEALQVQQKAQAQGASNA